MVEFAAVKPALICLLFTLLVSVLNSQNTSCNSADLAVLRDFLKGQDIDNLGWHPSSDECCQWPGVGCTNFSRSGVVGSTTILGQRVLRLDLGGRQLKGLLPNSLAGLEQLRVLNLSSNVFTGPLPQGLFRLQHLQFLDLSSNSFNGFIPSTASLPSIRVFDISGNSFSGPLPHPPAGSLNLTKFIIGKNEFDSLTDASSICNTSLKIQVLDLSSNRFTGSIPPGISHCRSLTDLYLNSNHFSGNLPDDLFGMTTLRKLLIHGNRLSGQLDRRIQNLKNLVYLDVSDNDFTGVMPDIFNSLTKLEHFSASYNSFSGMLPETLSSHTLIHLDLRENGFQGRINLNCTQLVHLRFLDLSSNRLTGSIPSHLSQCTQLSNINLSGNKLKGLIPDTIKNIRPLYYLALADNGFHNLILALQVLQQCGNLTVLVLAGNFVGEEIPPSQITGFINLKVFSMPNCSLRGEVPTWLSNSTELKVLDLSRNELTGTIPSFIGCMKFLTYLNLSHNKFSGTIPINLTDLTSLQSKFVPFLYSNQRTEELLYTEFFKLPPAIDLSDNQLNGRIWEELGNLKVLVILDLSFNHLSSDIPTSLSYLSNMEVLDLSNNNLTGTIPDSLTSLTFMSSFSVANNRLDGVIPIGGQFSTFPRSSFEGNLRLCGEHYQPCEHHPTLPPKDGPTPVDKPRLTFDGLAFGLGAATGFLITITVTSLFGFFHEKSGAEMGAIELSRWFWFKSSSHEGRHGHDGYEMGETIGSMQGDGLMDTIWDWPAARHHNHERLDATETSNQRKDDSTSELTMSE